MENLQQESYCLLLVVSTRRYQWYKDPENKEVLLEMKVDREVTGNEKSILLKEKRL